MSRLLLVSLILILENLAYAELDSEVMSPREKVMQISSYYQQKRKLAEIAESQRMAESRHFIPMASFESFTLTDADPIQPEEQPRHPASE